MQRQRRAAFVALDCIQFEGAAHRNIIFRRYTPTMASRLSTCYKHFSDPTLVISRIFASDLGAKRKKKINMNPKIDNYLAVGCGRCPLGGTPQCKVHKWTDILVELRRIVLGCGLAEELKWSVPCYTFQNTNVLMVSAFNDYAFISFFKGVLLLDEQQLLVKQGEHVQAGRLIKFQHVQQVFDLEQVLKTFIFEAIELEKAGIKVPAQPKDGKIFPEELEAKITEDPIFGAAFLILTPGRQRGYMLHFSQPKQAATRVSRIEKCTDQILEGKGIHDDYKKQVKP
jgi:uncharacterized protein YdeI (YjbR/CyaY-like superfamily)